VFPLEECRQHLTISSDSGFLQPTADLGFLSAASTTLADPFVQRDSSPAKEAPAFITIGATRLSRYPGLPTGSPLPFLSGAGKMRPVAVILDLHLSSNCGERGEVNLVAKRLDGRGSSAVSSMKTRGAAADNRR